ncbi:ribonuclease P protein subunit p29 [Megalops cyprinoides]|uniref:ribonuclease P protein subunit p29 n=1 Tax=Megalops cyprinoides TaxID=118141 RepID=UPI0018650713|nr:ribonuclease P protein subunit p29 [Megalops cyprinoides]
MERQLNSRLSEDQSKLLGVQSQDGRQAEAFTKAFLKNSLPSLSQESIRQFMDRKAVVLEFAKKKKEKQKRKRAKGLNAKQRREMKVFQLKEEHQKYELFLPLHELWKQYIRDLCNGLKSGSNPQIIQQKLLKADFHGAIITVVRSKCPSYVGTTGILVQEMKHVFKIITKENKLKVIPKRNSVFGVEIDGFVTHIYGSKFQLRSSERSAKKFKVKGTIDL